jgi:hypothetical protein
MDMQLIEDFHAQHRRRGTIAGSVAAFASIGFADLSSP